MKKKINNYRFQQQQQAKQKYQKVKKIKEKWENMPVDASNELDYIKKLLDGEDVGNFGPEEPVVVEKTEDWSWMSISPTSSVSKMSLSELLSVGSIKQRKRL
jgi:hypothetical protein